MKDHRYPSRFSRALAGLMLTSFASGLATLQAGEVQIPNSNFDETSIGWYWENWSAAGSAVSYDAALDAAGGGTPSGSLRLAGNFNPANSGWQEAVYTLDIPDVDAGASFSQISFDVKVDPASTPRAEGDYGNIQVILRNGGNWDWKQQQPMVALTGTEWTRVTFRLANGEQPIDQITALTIRVAQNAMQGPVTVNIDNIAWTEEVVIENADNGVVSDPPLPVNGWSWENWSQAGSTVLYDPLDFYGRETSGSVRLNNNFTDNPGGYQQAVFTFTLPAQVNAGVDYSHINLDVKVDPSSTPRAAGDYGFFEIILRNGGGWDWIATGPPQTTGTRLNGTDWVHISMPVRSGDRVHHITLKLGENAFLGPVILNVDNVSWTKNTVPPPPPTLSISKAPSGLSLVATSNDQYGRHNIYSADNSQLGWYGVTEPVSYSFTLARFPGAENYAGFQAHLFLVPGNPGNETSPDWNEPHLIFLDVRAGANGTGNATLRWKINQPGGNSQLYAGGLPNVASATVLGTWKVTISENTHFIVTAPDGATTNFDLAPEAAAMFDGPIRVYVGVQPNNSANIGQSARLAGVNVSQGATVLLEDDFSGDELDTSKWVANATPGGVQFLTPAEAGFYVSWGVPDSGFVLQWSSSLEPGATWTDSTAIPINLGPLRRQVHLPGSELPPGNQAYYRLLKPAP